MALEELVGGNVSNPFLTSRSHLDLCP
jgi:hypothetical protein